MTPDRIRTGGAGGFALHQAFNAPQQPQPQSQRHIQQQQQQQQSGSRPGTSSAAASSADPALSATVPASLGGATFSPGEYVYGVPKARATVLAGSGSVARPAAAGAQGCVASLSRPKNFFPCFFFFWFQFQSIRFAFL